MNILEKIVWAKRKELAEIKKYRTISSFTSSPSFSRARPSFYESLNLPAPSVITEFKRKSPSRGILNETADCVTLGAEYQKAGAAALSVLTDIHFGGDINDLKKVASSVQIPVLRKDFIIDEFQVYEAREAGASAILLIASVLDKNELKKLSNLARDLELDVLLEIHEEEEIKKIPVDTKIIGVNNRNLKTFHVDVLQSVALARKLPSDAVKVAESGIKDVDVLFYLFENNFTAFLMGEKFMATEKPGKEAEKFISTLSKKYQERE